MKPTLAVLALVLLTFPAFAQTPDPSSETFQEKLDVNLVLVDTTVTDSRGNQILGLTKDDFIVRENGVPQEIQSVDYYTNRTLLTAPEAKAEFQVERVKEERYFIVFFDKLLGAAPSSIQSEVFRARRAVHEFIDERMLPQDRMAIVGHDARLKVYADFTSDPKILKKALDDAVKFSDGLKSTPEYAGDFSILKNLETKKLVNDTGRIYNAIEVLAESLPRIPARKVMMLFSLGIGETDDSMPQFLENEDYLYDPMVQALNEANVTVYPINLLRNVTQFYPQENTLSRMAAETGGEYFRNFVNFLAPLEAIEKENNGYYMITYNSRKPEGASGYQEIDVEVKNPEFRVKAREGYVY